MKLSAFDSTISQEIIDLFENTFSDSEGADEGQLIGALVDKLISTTDQNDLLGFVASKNSTIIGCIFFSRFFLPNDKTAFILSPVSVSTDHQRKGVGQQLINYGIEQLRLKNIDLLFTYGDPNYYSKVGFQPISEDIVKAPLILSHPEGWLAQSLDGNSIEVIYGAGQCVEALSDQKYW